MSDRLQRPSYGDGVRDRAGSVAVDADRVRLTGQRHRVGSDLGLTDQQVAELATSGEEMSLEAGTHLFDEGRPADDWWLLLRGRIDLVRRIGHDEAVMATMQTPGQWAGGFRAWDEHGVYMGSARVIETSRVFRVPAERLSAHGEAWFPFAVHLLRGLIGTARRIEQNARQREALVLRFWLDLPFEQVAAAMGVKQGTAKSQVSRGLATLARALGDDPTGIEEDR